ncbi:hypothetical protein E2C01_099192 [Portunus trituberculatus]|uniref:Uncharacterized protein n=1 Tax=Portunus trituberculatus TaxID=210409 RepID=A0A5B7K387_PORTR|nr:hypothetical protein [Portunus trituberculatus]
MAGEAERQVWLECRRGGGVGVTVRVVYLGLGDTDALACCGGSGKPRTPYRGHLGLVAGREAVLDGRLFLTSPPAATSSFSSSLLAPLSRSRPFTSPSLLF